MQKVIWSPEVQQLRERVAAGNEKLIKAFLQIQKMPDGKELDDNFKAFGASGDKLVSFAKELSHKFVGCYYTDIEEERYGVNSHCTSWPDGMVCFVCGNAGLFWDDPVSSRSEEIIEFLKNLSEEI
jgi:hypothetical protein